MRPVRRRVRLGAAIAVLTILASACAGATDVPAAQATSGSAADPSASDPAIGDDGRPICVDGFFWEHGGCTTPASIDLLDVLSGGPPPDGIPAIERPIAESLERGSAWLQPQSPVLRVEVNGFARAYPLSIMTVHEIANDVIDGVPVAVTYCPLCNSGLAFTRTVDGEVLDFGTSGRLYRSNLLMYDRQTRTLWSQFLGEGVVGAAHLGTTLERLPTTVVSWQDFLSTAGPDDTVLSRDTGLRSSYGRNPYRFYDDVNSRPFLYEGPSDDRLVLKARVVGLGADDTAVAVERSLIERERLIEVSVDGVAHVLVHRPGAASALDTSDIDAGADIGAVAAFLVADEQLSVPRRGASPTAILVSADGTEFDLTGRAISGPRSSASLQPVALDDTFWFVWFAFERDTELVTELSFTTR